MNPKGSNPPEPVADREVLSSRLFAAPRDAMLAAFADPSRLAQWWGPKDFTNTIHEFDLKPGGRWRLTMHAPGGAAFENESVFVEVANPERVIFRHLEPVHAFEMTMTFAEEGSQTRLTWRMLFDSAAECARVKNFVVEGNEQNFDRLQSHLAAHAKGASSATADREIVITREFNASRELVWQAMTDPKHVVNWWGPRGFTTTIEEMDVRPGGVWKHTMHGPDGANYPNKSVFKEVVKPERIVYSHGGGHEEGHAPGAHFVATWTFVEVAPGKTSVTIRMLFSTPAARDFVVKEFGAIEGGKQTLARLSEYMAEVSGIAPKRPVVRITRSFTAPAEWVFDAWLDPAMIGRWMFGSALREEEVLHLKADAHVGGKFSFLVRRQGTEIDHVGTYREIDRPHRLVFTWGIGGESADESVVTIDIRATGQGCDLTLTHEMDPKWAEYASRTEAGWTKMLGALAGLVPSR